ncbi:hypothetical protein [Clostridium saccharoperbutylacetonicum]|uniref:hypothetical protein n=1 Tax=Clostridium saccharoperbutylacetonicum TaxID=36745 RepID=UPI000983F2E8|nr:hypothetical protein [Clostridium saccharoperbutylacetonicum]AQR95879.1 hypothetical protein CLSAP_31950 [Clostridium saccharoperbutylacetonicum]NSB31742.1 hypothetical protein [Clostridium saccharoperbutylacetonicum]
MKLKLFLTVILISAITFTEYPKAILQSNTYKEGVYDITNTPQVKATAMLTTPNTVASLILIDPNGNEVFYKKFDTANESVNLGTILDDDRIAIIGKGEIAITINL